MKGNKNMYSIKQHTKMTKKCLYLGVIYTLEEFTKYKLI